MRAQQARCPAGVHVEKERKVLRRLARLSRSPPPQSPLHQKGRAHPANQDAARGRHKKSPALGTARAVLEAYAEALSHRDHRACAARELAQIVGSVPTHQLTPLHPALLVSRWRSKFSRNTTAGRRAGLVTALRNYEAFTGHHGLAASVPRVPGRQARQVIATPDELRKLHAHADPLLRVWLRMCTALALGGYEAHALAPANYNAENKTVSFTRKKTGTPQTLPVPDDLAAIFEAAPHHEDPTVSFLQRYNRGRPIGRTVINRRWNALKKRAGVNPNLNPHDLRRTTATALYDLTKDLRVVQQLLGHGSLTATTHYIAGHDPAALRPLLAQLWTPKTEFKQ